MVAGATRDDAELQKNAVAVRQMRRAEATRLGSQLDHADVQVALAARLISQQHEVSELYVVHLYIDIEDVSIYIHRNSDSSL